MTMKEACNAYMKLLKYTEELTQEQRSLARESFNEGWLQCELAQKQGPRNPNELIQCKVNS